MATSKRKALKQKAIDVPAAQVYLGSAGQMVLVELNEESRKVLDTLYCDPFTKVYACNHRDGVRALQPFMLKT